LHYAVDSGIRRQTLDCCVTAAGDVYYALLASGDRSKTQISDTGVRDGIDLKIEIASSPYVTQDIFDKDIDEILIPAVISNRDLPGCKDKPSILFCENCSGHCSHAVLDKMAWNGVLVITYPPHTSYIFQASDLVLFGILKRPKKYQRRDDTLGRGVDHVLRLFRAFEQAIASTSVTGSWLKPDLIMKTAMRRDISF
jgi:hypothetical protein